MRVREAAARLKADDECKIGGEGPYDAAAWNGKPDDGSRQKRIDENTVRAWAIKHLTTKGTP